MTEQDYYYNKDKGWSDHDFSNDLNYNENNNFDIYYIKNTFLNNNREYKLASNVFNDNDNDKKIKMQNMF